jgi:hypothetical protein
MGIQLGLTDSLRCKLPEGTDGTGYWTITVYALGYQDYTVSFKVADENIVKSESDSQESSAPEKPAATEVAATTETPATTEIPTATESATTQPTATESATTATATTVPATNGALATQTPAVVPATEQAIKTAVKVGSTYTTGSLKYRVTSTKASKRTVTVIAPKNKKLTSVTIPATVKIQNQTYKVTAVSDKAFANCKKLKKVVIGKNVATLGKNVFAGDSKLTSITIQSAKLKKVGSGVFKGISGNAKIKVPSAQLKKYKKLLKGKGQGSKVKIVK